MPLLPPAGVRQTSLGRAARPLFTFALMMTTVTLAAQALGARFGLNPTLVLLFASPWVLGLLILVFEMKSQLKFWAAPLLLAITAPTLAVWFNWQILQRWPRNESLAVLIAALLVNILLIGGFTFYVRRLCPRCCPECANWSMIPLRNFWGVEQRIRDTLWCTCCGSFYFRTSDGEWRKERRRIWLDVPKREAKLGAKHDSRPFDTDSRLIASVVRDRSKTASTPARAALEAERTSVATPCGEDSGMPGA